MPKITKDDLVKDNNRLRGENTTYFLVINDLVEGKITWFNSKSGFWRVGVGGVTRANGGHVIIYANQLAQAYDYEYWKAAMENLQPSHQDSENIEYKNLYYEIQNWVTKQFQKEFYGKEL